MYHRDIEELSLGLVAKVGSVDENAGQKQLAEQWLGLKQFRSFFQNLLRYLHNQIENVTGTRRECDRTGSEH